MKIFIPCPDRSETLLRQIVLEFLLAQNSLSCSGQLKVAGETAEGMSFESADELLHGLLRHPALTVCTFKQGASKLRFERAQDGLALTFIQGGPEPLCLGVEAKRELVQKLVRHYEYENGCTFLQRPDRDQARVKVGI